MTNTTPCASERLSRNSKTQQRNERERGRNQFVSLVEATLATLMHMLQHSRDRYQRRGKNVPNEAPHAEYIAGLTEVDTSLISPFTRENNF